MGIRHRPWINGEITSRLLTREEYAIVSELVNGPVDGRSTEDLNDLAEGADRIFQALIKSHDPWADVILPWEGGGGFAVASPDYDYDVSARPSSEDLDEVPDGSEGSDVPEWFVATQAEILKANGLEPNYSRYMESKQESGDLHFTKDGKRYKIKYRDRAEHVRVYRAVSAIQADRRKRRTDRRNRVSASVETVEIA